MFASVRKNRLWGENEKQGGREDAVILWNNNNVDNDDDNDNDDDDTDDDNDDNDNDDDDDNDEDNKNIKSNAEVFKRSIRFS